MVPSGWVRHLGSDITTKITKGSSPKWQGFDYQSEGTLFVTSENVRDGFLDVSKPKYLPLEFNQKLKNSQLQQGDILINIVGASIGRSCQYDLSEQQANINQAVCLFRTNELAESDFIQQYLQLPSTINRLLGTQSESARPNLSLSDMRDFLFALPPLPEQRKIAKILSTWDKAITTTEKLIETSKQQKKALMQQLLTGKKRLVNPETGKAFEGEWEEVKISTLITKHSEKTETNKQYPVLTSSRKGIYFQSDYYNDRDVASEDTTGYNVVPRGYFTYRHMSDDLVFKFNRNTICDKGIVSTLYPVFAAKEEAVVPYLLQAILNEGSAFKRFSLSQKQGGSRTYMYLSKLNELKIQIPSLTEQQKITSALTAADKEIEVLEAKLAHFKQEKKALMQQLLTGKRRVKVDEEVAA
ncbi:restriction endonuclease subunit S [Vibrio diabolicus]|uniref:restriction endonuclease subunit S n=1 Tax=Vibrio diabolicus TaxID=50719 RepID=UPI00211B405A|nr:restriction endonuclease subunit S [Vibrio diabolicus]MCG6219534.1 restriction endonuclease subunit S [Vibrio diabolicus]MDG2668681.1 restriction endonuclease subunit S [Vibrio parahaemolyticus]